MGRLVHSHAQIFMPSAPFVPLVGAHTSAAGGAHHALLEGAEIGATTIQLFTSNQRQWRGRPIAEEELAAWRAAREQTAIRSVMSHDSYLINLGSSNPELLEKSRQAFREEIERCHRFDIPLLNFHPGAATGAPTEECLDRIVESLLLCAPLVAGGSPRLLLETTAGQGSSVGHSFDQLGYLVERVCGALPIGVCIDTCHIFAAGYEIRSEEGWRATLEAFETHIGLSYLAALHLNDSQQPLGSRRDRHAPLGQGQIGIDCFRIAMTHPALRALPHYLETPEGPPGWKREIALLKEFAHG